MCINQFISLTSSIKLPRLQNERLTEDLHQERLKKEHFSEELRHLKDSSKLTSRRQGQIEVLQDEVRIPNYSVT